MSASPMHLTWVFVLRHDVDPDKDWLSAVLSRKPVNQTSPSLNSHSPSSSAINSKHLVSKYATRKSPFKLWFLSTPPLFLILLAAATCWGELVVCSFLLLVFPFALCMGEDGRGWKWTRSSTNVGQVKVSPASDSVSGTELHGHDLAQNQRGEGKEKNNVFFVWVWYSLVSLDAIKC